MLDDGSALWLPKYYQLSANEEVVNTIGVAFDCHAPLSAADLSAGRGEVARSGTRTRIL
jgi:hypothetical protein